MDICRTILIRLVLLTNAGDSIEATKTITAKIRKIPYLLNTLESMVTHPLPLFGLVCGNDSRIFHNTPFYAVKLIPVAIWRIFSCVASARESSPTLSPSCMTMIRSLIPRTSGNSDEIMMIALPERTNSVISR